MKQKKKPARVELLKKEISRASPGLHTLFRVTVQCGCLIQAAIEELKDTRSTDALARKTCSKLRRRGIDCGRKICRQDILMGEG